MQNPIPDGRVFFLEWPTWAQLGLLLCGALVFILIIAFLMRLRNWAQDKRRTERAAEEQAERGEMTLVLDLEDDVRFGIRALLEDPEVEGVWNSREATPMHNDGAAPSPFASPSSVMPQTSSSNSSTLIHDTADIGLASPTALTPLTHCTGAIDPLAQQPTAMKRGKTLVISYKGPSLRSEAAETVPDISSSTTPGKWTPSPSKMQLRATPNITPSSSHKFVIGNRRRVSPRHRRTEVKPEIHPLEGMEAHRRLHSAESGQLRPRDRRHSDLAQTIPLTSLASDSDDSDDSASRALSWPTRNGTMHLGKQISRRVQRMEGPRPIPFRAFVESLPTSKPPPSAWTGKTQARMEARLPSSRASDTTSKTSRHTPNSSTGSTTTATAATASPPSPLELVSIANTRSRKVNDGFEVLPAGTFEKEPKIKEFGTWHDDLEAQKKPKKLQKRTRSDSASRSSTESRRLSSDSFRLPIF